MVHVSKKIHHKERLITETIFANEEKKINRYEEINVPRKLLNRSERRKLARIKRRDAKGEK